MTNAEKYPKVWKLFVNHARNVDGLYQIHNPDKSGTIICADTPGELFEKFKDAYHKPLQKVAYIANNLNH